MTRRSLLKRSALGGAGLLAASALPASLAGKASASSKGAVTITFATWGGVYQDAQQKAWIDPFTKANPNIKVEVTGPVDYGKIKAMVEAKNVTWDVVDVNGDFGGPQQASLLTPINCSVVEACTGPLPGLVNTKWRVAENSSALTLAYNSHSLKGVPTGWADVFNLTKFPGKRTFANWSSGGALEAALLADGVPPHKLYPLDVKRALAKLDTIKSNIIWWSTGTQSEQLLGSGEAVMGGLWAGRIYDLQTSLHKPVGIVWNDNVSFGSYLVVPKGTKHPQEAMQLVNYITSAANNAKFSYYYPLGPGAAGAVKKADPKLKTWFASSHTSQAAPMSDLWWNANIGPVTTQFTNWQQS